MKLSKMFSVMFGVLAVVLALFTVVWSFMNIEADPGLIEEPEAAHEQIVEMMDAFCAGDYAAAQQKLYGAVSLGMDREAADEVGRLIWDAFQGSMSYELVGELYATDSGMAQDIRIFAMDINSVTGAMQETTKTLLDERVRSAEDLDEVYDENNEYQDAFVMQVLCEAAQQAIDNDSQTTVTELTLNLVWFDEQWWVVSNDALLKAVSGGVIG